MSRPSTIGRLRPIPLIACVLLGVATASAASAQEGPDPTDEATPETLIDGADEPGPGPTLRLDQGFVLDLPAGWALEDADDDASGDATGRRVVRVVCRTQACARTKETCTLRLRSAFIDGADDAARLAGLYATPLPRYFRLRAVLKSTSAGATIRRPLGPLRFGTRDWIAVETQAAARFKSGLFAETVVDGRYLGAICKTCETDTDRYAAAHALLGSVRREERAAAR